MKVTWEAAADADAFRKEFGAEFEAWIKLPVNHTFTNAAHKKIVFNKAHVLNGLHSTTSKQDPDPTDHVTVRLSDAGLDSRKEWYVLHWRPKAKGGNCVILAEPDSEEANNMRKTKRKEKKLKHRAKLEEERKKQEAEEAKRKAAEDAKKKAEDAKRKAAENAKKKAEDARKKAADDARKKAENAKKAATSKKDDNKDKGGGAGTAKAKPLKK